MRDLVFHRYDAARARTVHDLVTGIYLDAYGKTIATGDPFQTEEAFRRRLDAYTARDCFDLVIAYHEGEAIGQTFGWALPPPDGGWWRHLLTPVEPGWAEEDGHRTFALSEIMVRQAWTRRGVAHALHDELLSTRPESRATLLVRPSNITAYRAYAHWGWRKAAQLRNALPHAPLFDVLTLPLPLHPPDASLQQR
ncbi:GNAT family N-acetyltransferase [Streptosporangium sp. NPDC005286]|uniref:GNAT family N-acetyltransferase n=1 Tax=Streptosporangium sp. NPDC005286 TaxID=3154463 RepID=UPI0033ACEA66